ncbi:MAG TPA: S41 family peptidase [Bryobacteraceae bacterium]|nr:S41 family peptidase [Bryobacteraceae bacterium]
MCHLRLLIVLAVAWPGYCQYTRQNIATILGFENNTRAGVFPNGWSGNSTVGIATDDQSVHSGKYSCRLDRTATSTLSFSTITQDIPIDFTGNTIQWRGWIKMQNVSDYVALWAREDDAGAHEVEFSTMQGLGVSGTADWQQYSITIPWDPQAKTLYFGFFLSGAGTAWVDDLELLVDGVPVAQTPNGITTVLDTDHQFDNGSGIALTALSDIQVSNLAMLGKVWGFVKYHHPAVTSGQHHWDYDLFRVMPQVLAAPDAGTAQAAISAWIASLGPVPPCSTCSVLASYGLALSPDLDWLADTTLLGADLSQTLQTIYSNRPAAASQFFVSLVSEAGNPSFDHELAYSGLTIPDAGYQLLALFRFWNMVEYFYPNRAIISDDPSDTNYWNEVLLDSIPLIGTAQDSFTYQQELIRFIARIHDTHANLWTTLAARPPYGSCYLPVDLRFVEGQAYVLRTTDLSGGPPSGLQPGDLILQLDGASVSDLVTQWGPLYADSNQAARLRDMSEYLTRGSCGAATVLVDRGGDMVTVNPNRIPPSLVDFSQTYSHDVPGPAFQMLAPDVAYVKIGSLKRVDCAADILAAAGTAGLIIDIRDYPSDFPIYVLGGMLVTSPTPFAWFTLADIANPGAFQWGPVVQLTPSQPHYKGIVTILVDETTQSSAEFHAMAFRAAGGVVIGSTTAGADGNVSTVLIPGGLSSDISGLGVYYPDQTPTQRVGIIPDIQVTPTVAGLRAGRDELIDAAMAYIRGNQNPVSALEGIHAFLSTRGFAVQNTQHP